MIDRWLLPLLVLLLGACARADGPSVRVHVPRGATFSAVTDSLDAKGLVRAPRLFRLYARVIGAHDEVKPGVYEFRRGTGWVKLISDLRAGRFLRAKLVIPEGWDVQRIAERLAAITELPPESVAAALLDSGRAARAGVPGPTFEGYLYPATYTLAVAMPLDVAVGELVAQYRRAWRPAWRARADSLGLSEREAVTLASIIESEAKRPEEMPLVSAVYHNRLRIHYPLQADPTVQYALGRRRERLLYAHIDSVADSPYNTYTHAGLPPGPIASPSVRALEAALYPADVDYLYFVARPDGSHVFTRSIQEHNRVKEALRRERRALERH
ncbi:MAG: endolytic transglycosylase MltG [Gemmatimonadetes bacterium]|nr:endolytic transglycosylase MltG [Gemmatimonadota bacterium]